MDACRYGAHIPPIPFRLTGLKTLEPYRQPVLADDIVRYVGEPVAVVFADDAYVAEDAAELVELSIEPLPATMLATGQPAVYAGELSTEPGVLQKAYGDVDAAFRNAHAIVSLELSIGRHSGVPMETRGAIARYDAERDVLELHGAAKVPHWNRDAIAQLLGRPEDSVQLYEGHVGGGFGIRGEIYPEDILVCAATLKFKRPVKWIEDRREHLIAANHSREQHHRVRAAIDAQGHIFGIDNEFFHDNGAYMRTHAATVPRSRRGDVARALSRAGVPRNRTSSPHQQDAVRHLSRAGPLRVHLRTRAAARCDRGESRRRHGRNTKAQPDRQGRDALQARARYARHADRLRFRRLCVVARQGIEDSGWPALQKQLVARRKKGEKVGAGVAMFVEKSGLGPFDTVRSRGEAGRASSRSSLALPRSARVSKRWSRRSVRTRSASTIAQSV